jgi:biotin carboxyl carrier protein
VRFEIEAAGKTRVIDVSRRNGEYVVRVDGQPRRVDVAQAARSWSLLIDGRSYDVAFADRPGGVVVYVNGRAIEASRGEAGRRSRGEPGAAVQAGPQRIVAPMPGRIIKLLVKTGDVVAARQGLVVVEAMKMENELRSPRAGTVTEVRVAEGMSVDARTVLVVVD